jgi:opacity protein-like surface antigen
MIEGEDPGIGETHTEEGEKMKKAILVVFLTLLFFANTRGMAQGTEKSSDLWVYGGILKLEDQDTKGMLGARYDYHINAESAIEGTIGFQFLENVKIYLYHANYVYNLPLGNEKLIPFVTGGAGAATFSFDDNETALDQALGGTSLSINFGGGIQYAASEKITLRFDVRDIVIMYGERTIESQNVDVGNTNNLEFTAGVSLFFL